MLLFITLVHPLVQIGKQRFNRPLPNLLLKESSKDALEAEFTVRGSIAYVLGELFPDLKDQIKVTVCIQLDEFCSKNDEFCSKNDDFHGHFQEATYMDTPDDPDKNFRRPDRVVHTALFDNGLTR